ncbi:hypothetical protein EVAR_16962_1 [Eumeta japonica]|uniref:Uncharacterized protein n=1 Tax=Eumeta variegata TaxID=151549 RepID=A0A4C1TWI9_EUMVA|nr:hypothetical protein EVAR_16962_1 [Eumeta japonica]
MKYHKDELRIAECPLHSMASRHDIRATRRAPDRNIARSRYEEKNKGSTSQRPLQRRSNVPRRTKQRGIQRRPLNDRPRRTSPSPVSLTCPEDAYVPDKGTVAYIRTARTPLHALDV